MSENEKRLTDEEFERFIRAWPESKLELLEGKLLVGNCLDGSRLLFQQILRGWKAEAAVALGAPEQWLQALQAAFGLPIADQENLSELQKSDAGIEFCEEDLSLSPGREGEDAGHRGVRQYLTFAMHGVSEQVGAHSLGRDIVMKLGDNGFTPDLFVYKSEKLNTMYKYYLDGPAELVVEVVQPAHRKYDREIKREFYARGGVPEYLIVDPEQKQIEFHLLVNGDYRPRQPDADGKYRPRSLPGLAISPELLWGDEDSYFRHSQQPFIVEQPAENPASSWKSIDNGQGWGALPFAPKLDLQPVRIRFDEYIAWCPESKFEFMDGRPDICGRRGIRNLIGMLTMTFGMIETCRLLAPKDWVAALKQRRTAETHDQQTKDLWWRKARQIAAMLRDKHGLKRIGVTGDLVKDKPLDFWSELTMVLWDLPRQHDYEIYKDVSAFEDEIAPEITFLEPDGWHFKEDAEFVGAQIVEI